MSFAIQRATGKRLGTFVVIAGGPGGSGIAIADSYTDDYPARIAEHYDFVYPDQRGIGLSHPIGCPDATAAYYTSPIDPQDPAQGDAAGAVAKSYADACIAEAKIPEAELPLYATTQAVEDLEAIRDYLDVDKLDLYGESYGTQFVQTYAAAYPEHIRTLYLDGPVDLTLDGETFYGEAVRAFDDALVATLNVCAARPACRADFEGQGPLAAYDALAAKLKAGPIDYDFPMGDGTVQARSFTEGDLEDAVVGYMYSVFDRSMLTRALAASVDGNLVPLARLAAAALILDPDTLEADPGPDLVRRDVLRGRVPGLRQLGRRDDRCRPAARVPRGRRDAGRDRRPPAVGVLRRHALPVLAEPSRDGPTPHGHRRPALPDLDHGRDHRPDHPAGQRHAARRTAPRRPRHRPDRRPARDLRLGPVVPRRRRRRLPRQGQGARRHR